MNSEQELELHITIADPVGNIGNKLRMLHVDGERNDGVVLASDGYSIDIVKLERADGLPLAIDEDFEGWYNETFKNELVSSKSQVKRAYFAGRRMK